MNSRSLPLHSYEAFTAGLADREYFGIKLGLERISRLMDRLGNPERRFRSIHIAGTNGKGSTAAMIASILGKAGYRTGLYTSPHLEDFCERIRIDGELIRPEEVLPYARQIQEVEEEPLTFFEMATAIGFLHFAEKKVDVAVVETGLGGRLDATNVVTPIVSVITTVGLDHTAHLGNTLEAIAVEKAGIVKPGIPIVAGLLPPEATAVIERVAGERKAPLSFLSAGEVAAAPPTNLAGRHQGENAALAVKALRLLQMSGKLAVRTLDGRQQNQCLDIPQEAISAGLADVDWPGRLETVSESPWILLDGAHNPQAMRRVRQFLEENLRGRKLTVLFGAMQDKDWQGLLRELVPIADRFTLTAPPMARAADPQVIAQTDLLSGKDAVVVESVAEGVTQVLQDCTKNDVVLITGSLFVVGEARKCV